MASPELQWAKDRIAHDRGKAGVQDRFCDVRAARASLTTLDLEVPVGLIERSLRIDGLELRWVLAPDSDPNVRLVYLHGGGYLAGGYQSHRPLVAWLAQETKASVLFVDYRLAPEARFPAALDDAASALQYAFSSGPAGSDAADARVLIGGDSAGGGIAIGALLRRRDAGQPMPVAAFSLCGLLNLDEASSPFLQSSQRARDGARFVVADLKDLVHPQLSVVRADLSRLPPILLQTGSEDYCKNDSVVLADRAKQAGTDATLEVWPEMFHVWQRFAPRVPEAAQAIRQIAQFCLSHARRQSVAH